MLLWFSVENYMSFKNKALLVMTPSKDKEHPENICEKKDNRSVSVMATYGANGSGKTNFFRAITVALNAIRLSNVRQVNDFLGIVPFKFSEDTIRKPSKFEFCFIASDGKKYVYGFSADNRYIYEEHLERYDSSRAAKIFERKKDGVYNFTIRERNQLQPITQWNTPNKFFIATATMWNAQSTKAPFEWLSTGIFTYTDLAILNNDAMIMYQSDKSEEYIRFTEKLLHDVDINISKLDIRLKKIPVNPNIMPFVPGILVNGQFIQPQKQTQIEVWTYHDVVDEKGATKNRYKLQLGEESIGTQILFVFSPALKKILDDGKTIVIDEIDKSLHPSVVKYIINMFRDKRINKNGAQLIITTHDTSLLSLSIFRRDQIYLIDKDKDTAESTMKCLNQYAVRKGENIEKGYLLGRYGGVPDISGGDIL